MKIFISYPPIESDKGVPLLSQNRQFQWFNVPTYIYPMVPAYAATMLKNAGYEVVWDDAIAEKKTYQKWLQEVINSKPDIMMIETKTPVVKTHWKIIKELKEKIPSMKIVLVGDHVTALPEESFYHSPVDYVLTGGDYDFLLLNLVQYLDKKTDTLEPGIYYRDADGKVKNTGKFVLNHDLNKLPFIDRDLTKWWLYSKENGNYKRVPGTYTMVGRDCWWRKNGGCTFCAWTVIYPNFRTRTPESLLDEIGMLIEKYGVKEIMDDTGTFPAGDWLREFAEGMIKRGYNKKVYIDINMRLGVLSYEDYKLMKKANFRLVLVGIESANQKTLDRINKGVKVEDMVQSVIDMRRAGLYPHITIMFGYPWETYEDAKKTLELGKWLLRKNYAYTMQATIVIPYPGTRLFEECKENGWLLTEDWDRYDMREPVMKTPMPPDKLMSLVQEIYSVAFHPEFLFRRFISIKDFDDLKYFVRAGIKVIGHILDFGNKKLHRLWDKIRGQDGREKTTTC